MKSRLHNFAAGGVEALNWPLCASMGPPFWAGACVERNSQTAAYSKPLYTWVPPQSSLIYRKRKWERFVKLLW